ncbi:MAG: MMPL family transporter [Lysobacterales bacterium]
MSPRRRVALAGLWAAILIAFAALAAFRLSPGGDLRLFMPAAQTPDQRLLLDSLGEGPGTRLLLIAISGADDETLADVSQAMRADLDTRPLFRRVLNGATDPEAVDEALLANRYLLTPGFDAAPLDAELLRDALSQRMRDLASPAGALIEPWLVRDPTLEMLRLAEHWQPVTEPERRFDVWFDAAGEHALLLAETQAAGFDPAAQEAALAAIRDALDRAQDELALTLEITGPGAFSVLMRARTQGEATRLGITASALMVLLLGIAYRGWRLPLLGALPLASAALAGLGAVALCFVSVHGITLAFGFTLIGVALDYPVHLFSHRHPGRSAAQDAAAISPTLFAGAVSTCLAYASFLASGVAGLAQLAVFAIAGLLTAALTTRWLLPALLPEATVDVADLRWLARLDRARSALPRSPAWPLLLALAGAGGLALSDAPLWDDALSRLTPVPEALIQRDTELRSALGASDVRYMLVLEADDRESLLQRCEDLLPGLDTLVSSAAVGAVEPPCRYLPSLRTQRARQAQLPDADALQSALEVALLDLPFRRGAFEPFLKEVAAARTAAPVEAAALADTVLGPRLASLLPVGEAPVAVIALAGVHDPAALRTYATEVGSDLHLLDLKQASQTLAASYRERMLWALAIAFILLGAALMGFLRDPRRVLRVLLPVLLAAWLTAVTLHLCGVAFNLFHLVALILASGLGLDYALFFQRAGHDPLARRRTLHGILLCAISTVLVFGLLGSSSIPVLRAIGLTVALGVAFNLLLAAQLAASTPSETHDRA